MAVTDRTTRTLVLVRHARAQSGQEGADHERELTDAGRSAAADAGRWLAEHAPSPDAVLVSSAVRAVQTWQQMAAAVAAPHAIVDPGLYTAGPRELMDRVASLEAVTTVVVGHNPTVEQVITLLTGELRGMRPGAVAVVDLDEGRVVDVREPRG